MFLWSDSKNFFWSSCDNNVRVIDSLGIEYKLCGVWGPAGPTYSSGSASNWTQVLVEGPLFWECLRASLFSESDQAPCFDKNSPTTKDTSHPVTLVWTNQSTSSSESQIWSKTFINGVFWDFSGGSLVKGKPAAFRRTPGSR